MFKSPNANYLTLRSFYTYLSIKKKNKNNDKLSKYFVNYLHKGLKTIDRMGPTPIFKIHNYQATDF